MLGNMIDSLYFCMKFEKFESSEAALTWRIYGTSIAQQIRINDPLNSQLGFYKLNLNQKIRKRHLYWSLERFDWLTDWVSAFRFEILTMQMYGQIWIDVLTKGKKLEANA